MITALSAAASGMEAQQAQIQSISNNLANVNTTGYKRERAEFQDLLYETLQEPGANTSALTQAPVGIQRGMGVQLAGTQRNFEMGSPLSTGRDLDFMVKGNGFFVVQLPNGQNAYRRDGSFYRSATGRVETIDGFPVQPEINIPKEARGIEVTEDGQVYAVTEMNQKTQIAQMQLATFSNNGGLKAMGKNLYLETEASGPVSLATPGKNATGGILHKFLETSNVDVVKEMTDMISAQRAFEMNSKVIQAVDSMLERTASMR